MASTCHHQIFLSLFTYSPTKHFAFDQRMETDDLAAIQCYLRAKQGDLEKATDAVVYGPSTQNKIERWWRELLERLEYYFEDQLNSLVENGDYDSTDPENRYF